MGALKYAALWGFLVFVGIYKLPSRTNNLSLDR